MAPIPSFGRKVLDFFSFSSPKPQGKSSSSGSSLSRTSEESFEMMTFKPHGSELAPAPPFRAPAPAPAPFRPLRSSLVADSPPQLPNFDFGPAFEVPSKWTSAKRDLVFPEAKCKFTPFRYALIQC
ncbi:uncharacterized protein LAJ45_02047 [Morchella importuna]|uniref:uncharacterized protein n=1 Tax=Morchella importuna TaxID=1174673 RepID=UPI001E8E18E8|nr:uncharacterized protein LAJ45_02047 [Morchella importuna]KAH8154279.1 hypothetical protein LAJ45_02047 [Morchella importuna]